MYDDEDLRKASQLQDLGHFTEMDIIDLAKLLYKKRTGA